MYFYFDLSSLSMSHDFYSICPSGNWGHLFRWLKHATSKSPDPCCSSWANVSNLLYCSYLNWWYGACQWRGEVRPQKYRTLTRRGDKTQEYSILEEKYLLLLNLTNDYSPRQTRFRRKILFRSFVAKINLIYISVSCDDNLLWKTRLYLGLNSKTGR